MQRRKFLTSISGAMAGYGLFVSAPQTIGAAEIKYKHGGAKASKAAGGSYEEDPLMDKTELECDLFICGGGLAGVCAAIAAARGGAKVVLMQDRSRLGGNASSEIKMHPLGVNSKAVGWREGGILEELEIENALRNPTFSWEIWDLLLYDKCICQPNIRLFLDTDVYKAEVKDGNITCAWARSDSTRNVYKVKAKIYADCSGDSRMGLSAGASYFSGREGSKLYGESLADFDPIGTRQGSSLMFTSKMCDFPVPFKAPSWAKKITPEMLKYRRVGDIFYGMWWIELGGVYDAIKDNEQLRFELLSIALGVWDHVKNSGQYKGVENVALDTIGMLPGRRETYRLEGNYVLKQQDIEGLWRRFPDAVSVGGWTMDDHPAEGFYAFDRKPCRQAKIPGPYNIPYRCICSKNIGNLMMAGRNISCSHVAFTSTRVMGTCASLGQALGTAAAICLSAGVSPKQLGENQKLVNRLQQNLLRDGLAILNVKNNDENDVARFAEITASESIGGSAAENVVSGVVLDKPGENKNRWVASAANKPYLNFEFKQPQRIKNIHVVFDAGCYVLTQTGQRNLLRNIPRGRQPDIVKSFNATAELADGSKKMLVRETDNAAKIVDYKIPGDLYKSIRFDFLQTNGSESVIVKEIRLEIA